MSLRVISYGGGVQSTALIVLAHQGKIGKVDAALFANVGDDSEHPATLRYVREVMQPWAAARFWPIHELHRIKRTGEQETLMGRMVKVGSRSLPIPIRGSETGKPGKRSCTHDFKVAVVGKWLKAHGASKTEKATICLGISWDEIERLGNKKLKPYEQIEYPLIDLRLTREDCKAIIREAGLPVPPKSACFFCPFHRPSVWSAMRRDEPDLFQTASALETVINATRLRYEKDPVYLTRFGKPLSDAIAEGDPLLDFGTGPGAESCDDGYCWT